MKAIDLYSGIGGWALGLKLNNIEVIESYEWWEPAVITANQNFNKNHSSKDIRQIDFNSLPKNIDIVVGSPPCTQFSYSNRGGSGDISDGVIDLYKFFECISIVKPKFWAMENVPRVKQVLIEESKKGGQLYKFEEIIQKGFVEIFDMSEFGLPQKRKRCIAGNLDLNLLNSYKNKCKPKTLGQVIKSLKKTNIEDVSFNIIANKNKISDLEKEENLNYIEERMNQEMKKNHPVYNNMSFPEPLDKPARTITATCTRVSRESLIISESKGFRRLSVRERASIQGFPINYQFFGNSHGQKLKMIGNAIPPVFTYCIASAMKKKTVKEFQPIENKTFKSLSKILPPKTNPDISGKKFSKDRGFRFSPSFLRFKSGLRFQLSNKSGRFEFEFYYGDSKNIHSIKLNKKINSFLKKELDNENISIFFKREKYINLLYSSEDLQEVWINKKNGVSPFDILDEVEKISKEIYDQIIDMEDCEIIKILEKVFSKPEFINIKIRKNARQILSGLIATSTVNNLNN